MGSVKLRHFRPFPIDEIINIAKRVDVIGVVDRDTAFGSPTGGAVSSECKSALHNTGIDTIILPIITGIGGREVSVEQQKEEFKILMKLKETGELPKDMIHGTLWDGVLEVK